MYKWISISIVVAALIGGFSFYKVQEMKQRSIEMQARQKLSQEETARNEELFLTNQKQQDLKNCIASAEEIYWDYVRNNKISEDNDTGMITASQNTWDRAEKKKQSALDVCYHLYQ